MIPLEIEYLILYAVTIGLVLIPVVLHYRSTNSYVMPVIVNSCGVIAIVSMMLVKPSPHIGHSMSFAIAFLILIVQVTCVIVTIASHRISKKQNRLKGKRL